MKRNARMSLGETRRLILDMYGAYPPKVIASMCGRSVQGIRVLASAMGIKSGGYGPDFAPPWEPHEDKLLRERFGLLPVKELSRLTGRTRAAVMQRATKLKLGRRRGKRWSDAEDDLLRAHYPKIGAWRVAQMLGRSKASVKGRARFLRVRTERSRDEYLAHFLNP